MQPVRFRFRCGFTALRLECIFVSQSQILILSIFRIKFYKTESAVRCKSYFVRNNLGRCLHGSRIFLFVLVFEVDVGKNYWCGW